MNYRGLKEQVCGRVPLVVVGLAFSLLVLQSCATVREDDSMEGLSGFSDWPQRDQRVIENMRNVQIAAERYASDHGHCNYPKAIDDSFMTYFPGGIEGKTPAVVGPANPYDGHNQWPKLGNTITDVHIARQNKVKFDLKPGEIEYTSLHDGESYAIVGADHDGKVLVDPRNNEDVLVLSTE